MQGRGLGLGTERGQTRVRPRMGAGLGWGQAPGQSRAGRARDWCAPVSHLTSGRRVPRPGSAHDLLVLEFGRLSLLDAIRSRTCSRTGRNLAKRAPLPRYRPRVALPPYAYVPGRAPHPIKGVGGHSREREPFCDPPLDDSNWSRHTGFLFGLDLFNRGFFWEAHEVWEEAWHRVAPRSPARLLLQALIQIAAAALKARSGDLVRSRGLADSALDKLGRLDDPLGFGLVLGDLVVIARDVADPSLPAPRIALINRRAPPRSSR